MYIVIMFHIIYPVLSVYFAPLFGGGRSSERHICESLPGVGAALLGKQPTLEAAGGGARSLATLKDAAIN